MADIRANVLAIRRAIEAAAVGPVELMAVTKRHTPEEINPLSECGIVRIGENRVQEFIEKCDRLNSQFEPHIIGQLQRNKVKYIMNKVAMIESVDRPELAQEIDRQAQAAGVQMPVLIQVNLAREEQKGGVYIEDYDALMALAARLPGVKVKGLMAIMPNVPDAEEIRPLFRRMRELFERERDAARAGVDMEILSMGMSHDYRVAVSEGATQVRIGRAIFS